MPSREFLPRIAEIWENERESTVGGTYDVINFCWVTVCMWKQLREITVLMYYISHGTSECGFQGKI